MTSGDPNIALRGKLPEILSNVPIESYRMFFFYRIFLTLLVFELEGGGNICPPTMAKFAETATGARVNGNF